MDILPVQNDTQYTNKKEYQTPKGEDVILTVKVCRTHGNAKTSTNLSWQHKFVLLLNIQVILFQILIIKLFR